MEIVKVDHWMVRVPFRETINWGSGARIGSTRLICRIETRSGAIGWGETLCLIDTVPAVFANVVARLAIGRSVAEAEAFYRHVLGAGYYHHKRAAVMAMAALEMAMWDALGHIAGLPCHALWGGRFRDTVPAAAYTFTRDPDALTDRLRDFRDRGFGTFKVKIGFDVDSDIALATAARAAIGDAPLRLDVNGAWTPGTARRQLAKLAPLDPFYVEQPLELDDIAGHRALRQCQTVPIALDESAYTLEDTGNIVHAEAADVILLDPHQAGGLWPVIKAAGIAEAHGIPVTLHSGAELAISQAAYVHLGASIPNLSLAIDTERDYLAADIAPDTPPLTRGAYEVPTAPGLGVTPSLDMIEEFRVTRIEGAYLDQSRPGWFPMKPAY
ncbi:mandelate racemase/muconate lactonizing enzyme family protein [Psychromarinibacter halotolerans]|uniref:glucarate dehydratase n=1 Tax=Psychromarinibacter halotolerans TaxID=1775175 RepID=A0ABV7GQK4_9RHOB|nr:mandelate racemase/muconate lactonizing enzyme family protein [Psychromarinibacter halotolerans]MDF0597733.1 mandelate racemase/muconate lactonizing enzyme family protein [Psychromarinibacter halotolerans]